MEELRNRIDQKIKQIEEDVDFLKSIVPEECEEYKIRLTIKAACERYIQKIIESTIDIGFLVISLKKLSQPLDEDSAFDLLAKNNIISTDLSERLKDAKGMRNFIVHQYEKIDDEIVFNSLNGEIEKDVREFIGIIRVILK